MNVKSCYRSTRSDKKAPWQVVNGLVTAPSNLVSWVECHMTHMILIFWTPVLAMRTSHCPAPCLNHDFREVFECARDVWRGASAVSHPKGFAAALLAAQLRGHGALRDQLLMLKMGSPHLKKPHRFPFRGPKNVCQPSRNSHFFETIDLQNFYPDHNFYPQDADGCWISFRVDSPVVMRSKRSFIRFTTQYIGEYNDPIGESP